MCVGGGEYDGTIMTLGDTRSEYDNNRAFYNNCVQIINYLEMSRSFQATGYNFK